MLTEREISLQWRELFHAAPPIDESVYTKASELIDALPATSPLRQRYAGELSDLRRINLPPAPAAPKRVKRRTVG
jgi:hypothetical protein